MRALANVSSAVNAGAETTTTRVWAADSLIVSAGAAGAAGAGWPFSCCGSAGGGAAVIPSGTGLSANADLNLPVTATPTRYGPRSSALGSMRESGVSAIISLLANEVGSVISSGTT